MATTPPKTAQPPAYKVSPTVPAVIPVPPPPVTGTTTLEVQLLPAEKPALWEGPGFFPACAAVLAVAISAGMLRWSTRKNIDAAAERSKKELDHATEQAKEERMHAADQASLERDYAAAQATEDRLLKARQELYPKVIEDYVEVLKMFGKLPNVDLEKAPDTVAPLQEMAASVNKTWMFSDVDTAFAIREFYTELNLMNTRLMKHLPNINEKKVLLARTSETRARREKEHAEVWTEWQAYQAMPFHDKVQPANYQRSQQLDGDLKALRAARDALVEREARLKPEIQGLIKAYYKEMVSEQNAMMDHINRVMAAVRNELKIQGDDSKLIAQSKVMADRINDAMAEFGLGTDDVAAVTEGAAPAPPAG